MRMLRTITAIPLIVSAAAALLLSSCQVATPATRIEQNPVLFESLSEKDRALVQQGLIREGMSPEAVFLAWGYPNSAPFVGQKDGKRIVRWVYNRDEPVMSTPTWSGPCWGPYGCYHDHYMMPDTVYIPRNVANVTFENDKVVSWEALR